MPPPSLPVELFHEILQSLTDDLYTLSQCALVCRTLRYTVQRHLFSEITVHRFPHRNKSPLSGCRPVARGRFQVGQEEETRCSWLLSPAHSHLLSHVRHLKLQCYPPPLQNTKSDQYYHQPDPFFESVLELLPVETLNKITIMRRYRDDPLSDTMAIVTRVLKRCQSLTELCVEDRRIPAAYLAAVAGSIRVLRVSGTEFFEDELDEIGIVKSWPKLESLVFPVRLLPECLVWMIMGSSGFDDGSVFPRLRNLFLGDECKEVEIVNEVLEMCKSTLRSFVYTPFYHSELIRNSQRLCVESSLDFSSYPNPCLNQNGTVMEFNAPSSLRTLAINCPVMLKPASHIYPNPFSYLIHTFRRLSRSQSSSKLEVIHVRFLTTEQIEKLDALFPGGFPIDLCFHEFDQLLSNPVQFPRLKKVYLTVGRHYLRLFRDHETLPMLNSNGVLRLVYEEVSARRFWLCHTPSMALEEKESVDDFLWDGRLCKFV